MPTRLSNLPPQALLNELITTLEVPHRDRGQTPHAFQKTISVLKVLFENRWIKDKVKDFIKFAEITQTREKQNPQ